jgi:hypothetical protein
MGWTVPPEPPDILLHFSEDPNISRFKPHVPRTNPAAAPAVWAVDPAHASLYWFPRDCPRVAVWANNPEQQRRLARRLKTGASRVHAAPLQWLGAIRACRLYEYRFEPTPFTPWADAEGQWIAHELVIATAVQPVGDLLDRHVAAGIDARFMTDLTPLREAVLTAGLPFSIVRFPSG